VKPRPKVNPFGDAKPREVLLEEQGKDWRKIDSELEHRRVDRSLFIWIFFLFSEQCEFPSILCCCHGLNVNYVSNNPLFNILNQKSLIF